MAKQKKNGYGDPYSSQIRSSILQHLQFRGEMFRQDLAKIVSLSGGAITYHTRWLIEHGFINAVPKRIPTALRPVDELSINKGQGHVFNMVLQDDCILCEIADICGDVVEDWKQPLTANSQFGIMTAFNDAAGTALKKSSCVTAGGLSLNGYVNPSCGVIYGVPGVDEWMPCQMDILENVSLIRNFKVWPNAACKARGFAAQLKTTESIIYVDYIKNTFHIAGISGCEVNLGRLGTTGKSFHNGNGEGKQCYCGRHGCLAQKINDGQIDEKMLKKALADPLAFYKPKYLGLDGLKADCAPAEFSSHLAVDGIKIISDGLELICRGIRAFTAFEALKFRLEDEMDPENLTTGE